MSKRRGPSTTPTPSKTATALLHTALPLPTPAKASSHHHSMPRVANPINHIPEAKLQTNITSEKFDALHNLKCASSTSSAHCSSPSSPTAILAHHPFRVHTRTVQHFSSTSSLSRPSLRSVFRLRECQVGAGLALALVRVP